MYGVMLMKHSMPYSTAIIAATALACLAGEPFDLSWNTIDGGGVMRSSGGSFVLSGTIGQPDAGVMSGGPFELTGGFWFETPPGDCNANGVVGLMDHEALVACLTGPAGNLAAECACFDINSDGVVDLADVAASQRNFLGE